jgi:hypothetical protein
VTATAVDLCPGTYEVTVSDANGCSDVASIEINEGTPQTIPAFTFDTTLCIEDDAIDLPVTSDNDVPGGWSGNGVSGNTFTPADAGVGNHNITFMPDTGQCATTANVTMVVEDCGCQNPASADAGDDQSLCASPDVTVQLDGSINGVAQATWKTNGSGSFNDSTALDAVYTPSQADIDEGNVTLTLTTEDPDGSGPCNAASDQMEIILEFQPAIEPISDQISCFSYVLPDILGEVTANASYWTTTGGEGTEFLPGDTITETTTLYAYDSVSFGCSDEEFFMITINNVEVGAGEDTTVQLGTPAVLEGTPSAGSGDYVYAWTPDSLVVGPQSAVSETVPLEASQTFRLEVTDTISGCVITYEVNVEVEGEPLSVNAMAVETDLCFGDSSILMAEVAGGSGQYTYSWYDAEGEIGTDASIIVNPDTTTMYTLVVNDGFNQIESEVRIHVHPLPDVDAGEDQYLCYGEISLEHCTPSFSGGLYEWTNSEIDSTQSGECVELVEGEWILQLTDSLGCQNSDTLVVEELEELIATVFPDTTSEVSGGLPPYEKLFQVRGDTIRVTVTDLNGCTATDELVITSSLEPFKSSLIRVYPNPAHEFLYVEFVEHIGQEYQVSLWNTEGRRVHEEVSDGTEPKRKISIWNLPAGSYYLKVSAEGYDDYVQKVIVE